MLNAMREGAKGGIIKFIFFGLMGLATFGLVLTDAGGFFRGTFGGQTIAKIGDVEITLPYFNSVYSRELSRSNVPPESARAFGLPQITLARELNRLTLVQAAQETDLEISDAFVAQSIKQQLEQAGLQGDAENLDYALRQMNLSEKQLVQGTRQDTASNLVNTVTSGMGKATPEIIEAAYKFQNEKRVAEIVTVSPSDITDFNAASDDDIALYYENNQGQFTDPEKRDVRLLTISPDDLGTDITISDESAEQYYESNRGDYALPDQYTFSQAILDDMDVAKALAETVKTSGVDALKTVDKFVDTDSYQIKSLPDALQKALQNSTPESVIGPVETSLGIHVIYVSEITKDTHTPLTDVKKEITQILRDKELDDQIFGLADELDNAVADGLSLDEIAKQYSAPLKTISNLDPSGSALEQKPNDTQEIIETVFILEASEISPVIEISNGGFILTQVTQITPQATKPLETVKGDIKKALNTDRKQAAVQEKALELITAYRGGDKTLAQLARENNVRFNQTRALDRVPQGGVAVTTNEAQLLFSLTRKNDVSSLRVEDSVKIIRLNDIVTTKNIPTSGEEIDKLTQNLNQSMELELREQFLTAWKEELGVNINTKLFEQAFLTSQAE